MDPEPCLPEAAGAKKGIKFLLEEHAVRVEMKQAAPTRPPGRARSRQPEGPPPRRQELAAGAGPHAALPAPG